MITIEKPAAICFCPLHGILDTISKKWSLMVVAVVGNTGSMGFNEMKRALCNVSSKTLSSTLKDLEAQRLITRDIIDTKPPSVSYRLTESGLELRELLVPLLEWVMKNGGHEVEGCPIHIHTRQVNEEIKP